MADLVKNDSNDGLSGIRLHVYYRYVILAYMIYLLFVLLPVFGIVWWVNSSRIEDAAETLAKYRDL